MGKGHKGKKQRRHQHKKKKKKKGTVQRARMWTKSPIMRGNDMKLWNQVKGTVHIRCINCGFKFHSEDELKAHTFDKHGDEKVPFCKLCNTYHEVGDECEMEESSEEDHSNSEEDEKGDYDYDVYDDDGYD